jgi:hypothetical protein
MSIFSKWWDDLRDGIDDAWDDLKDSWDPGDIQIWDPGDVSDGLDTAWKAVENTAKAIADKPIQFVIQVGTSLLAPQLSPFVNAAIAAENGADFDDILRNVVLIAVTPKVSKAIGDYTSTALTELNINTNLAKSTSEIVSSVTSKIGKGGDLEFSIATSFLDQVSDPLQSAVNEFTGFFSDLETKALGTDIISPEVQDAIAKGVDIVAKTGTVTDAVVGLFSEQMSGLLDKTTGLVGEGFDDALTRAITASTIVGLQRGNEEAVKQAYYGSLRTSSEQKLGTLLEQPLENLATGLLKGFGLTQKKDGALVASNGVIVDGKGKAVIKDGKVQTWNDQKGLDKKEGVFVFEDGSYVNLGTPSDKQSESSWKIAYEKGLPTPDNFKNAETYLEAVRTELYDYLSVPDQSAVQSQINALETVLNKVSIGTESTNVYDQLSDFDQSQLNAFKKAQSVADLQYLAEYNTLPSSFTEYKLGETVTADMARDMVDHNLKNPEYLLSPLDTQFETVNPGQKITESILGSIEIHNRDAPDDLKINAKEGDILDADMSAKLMFGRELAVDNILAINNLSGFDINNKQTSKNLDDLEKTEVDRLMTNMITPEYMKKMADLGKLQTGEGFDVPAPWDIANPLKGLAMPILSNWKQIPGWLLSLTGETTKSTLKSLPKTFSKSSVFGAEGVGYGVWNPMMESMAMGNAEYMNAFFKYLPVFGEYWGGTMGEDNVKKMGTEGLEMAWATAEGLPLFFSELGKLADAGVTRVYGKDYVDPDKKSETDATLEYINDAIGASGFKAKTFVELTREKQAKYLEGLSPEAKKRMEKNIVEGNVVFQYMTGPGGAQLVVPVDVTEFSLGEDPSFHGTHLQASGGLVDDIADVLFFSGGGIGTAVGLVQNAAEAMGASNVEIERVMGELFENDEWRATHPEFQKYKAEYGGDFAGATAMLADMKKTLLLTGGVGAALDYTQSRLLLGPVSRFGSKVLGGLAKLGSIPAVEAVSETLEKISEKWGIGTTLGSEGTDLANYIGQDIVTEAGEGFKEGQGAAVGASAVGLLDLSNMGKSGYKNDLNSYGKYIDDTVTIDNQDYMLDGVAVSPELASNIGYRIINNKGEGLTQQERDTFSKLYPDQNIGEIETLVKNKLNSSKFSTDGGDINQEINNNLLDVIEMGITTPSESTVEGYTFSPFDSDSTKATDNTKTIDGLLDVTAFYTTLQNKQAQQDLQTQQDLQAQQDLQTQIVTQPLVTTAVEDERKKETEEKKDYSRLSGNAINTLSIVPPKVDLDYIYDFSSIFANPEQESKFITPFGSGRNTTEDLIKLMQTGPYDSIINPEGEEDDEEEEENRRAIV